MILTRFLKNLETFQEMSQIYLTGKYVKVSLVTSLKYVPFSSSFMPHMTMKIHNRDKRYLAEMCGKNLNTDLIDLNHNTSLLLDSKTFPQKYGCPLQLLNKSLSTHENLFLTLTDKDLLSMGRESIRRSIYEEEKSLIMLGTSFVESNRTKMIGKRKCKESVLKVEYALREDVKEGIVGGVERVGEKRVTKQFKLWLDPTRQKELKCVGSLIEIFLNEVPMFIPYKTLFNHIKPYFDSCWPVQLEFTTNKHVNVQITIGELKPNTQKKISDSAFEIPKYYFFTQTLQFSKKYPSKIKRKSTRFKSSNCYEYDGSF